MSIDDSTKDSLIRAARKLFAEKGLEGTTIKDIVEEAGVNASLVSYYFNGKEGLFQACVRSMGQANLQMANRILTAPKNGVELKLKLEFFVDEILNMHMENPDVTRIIHREMENNTPFMEEIFKSTFMEIFKTVQQFLEAGQRAGLIRADLDVFITSSILIGTIVQFGRTDHVCQRHFNRSITSSAYRQAVSRHIVDVFLSGSLNKESI
jgi:AcrR family transcriptional regulator